jgi:hypothetical protein
MNRTLEKNPPEETLPNRDQKLTTATLANADASSTTRRTDASEPRFKDELAAADSGEFTSPSFPPPEEPGLASEADLGNADLWSEGDSVSANTTASANQLLRMPESLNRVPGPANDSANSDEERTAPLFSAQESKDLHSRWDVVQVGFVDEPRKAVEEADNLVATAIKRLAEVFAEERARLEGQWDRGDSVSTEDLRLAMRRYRSFFQRLLSV